MNRPSRQRAALVSCAATLLLFGAACGTKGGDVADTTTSQRPTTSASTTATTQSTTTTTTTTEPTTDTTTSGSTIPDVSSWVAVTDSPSAVSFKLPKKPVVSTPAVTAPDRSAVKVRLYQALVNPNFVVQVSVFDLSGRSFDTDKAIDGVATSAKGTVSSRTHTTVDGLDVTDAKISLKNEAAVAYDRVFKLGDHAVQLQTLGLVSDGVALLTAHQALLSSFHR